MILLCVIILNQNLETIINLKKLNCGNYCALILMATENAVKLCGVGTSTTTQKKLERGI